MLAMAERKNLIRRLLDSRGMTTYALAKRIQMPWHNVNKLVEAKKIPEGTEYKTLRKVADALGVGIDDLETVEE